MPPSETFSESSESLTPRRGGGSSEPSPTGPVSRMRVSVSHQVKVTVVPAVQKSRAGQGSKPIIVATLSCLVIAVLVVGIIIDAQSDPVDDGTSGGAGAGEAPALAFDAAFACDLASIDQLVNDLDALANATAASTVVAHDDHLTPATVQLHDRYKDAADKAKALQSAMAHIAQIAPAPELEPEPEPEPEASQSLWYVGVGMSCGACFANVFGYNLVKRTHAQVEQLHRAGQTEVKAASKQFPLFFVGWFLSIVMCAGLDILAYGFAPVEMLAPLGGVTLLLNIWVAPFLNGEKVFPVDFAVSSLIVFGIAVTVLSVPNGAFPTVDSDFLTEHAFRGNYMLYMVAMMISARVVSGQIKKVYGDGSVEGIARGRAANPQLDKFSILLWPWIGSVFTSNMNVYVKCLLEFIKAGPSALLSPWLYVLFAALVGSTMFQLNAINEGLAREGALTFVPLKSAFNVVNMSIHSCTFFQTLDLMSVLMACRYVIGLATVTIGVLLILTRPVPEDEGEGEGAEESHYADAGGVPVARGRSDSAAAEGSGTLPFSAAAVFTAVSDGLSEIAGGGGGGGGEAAPRSGAAEEGKAPMLELVANPLGGADGGAASAVIEPRGPPPLDVESGQQRIDSL
jgi:hypothetical protein